jgi:hypothetical protein
VAHIKIDVWMVLHRTDQWQIIGAKTKEHRSHIDILHGILGVHSFSNHIFQVPNSLFIETCIITCQITEALHPYFLLAQRHNADIHLMENEACAAQFTWHIE